MPIKTKPLLFLIASACVVIVLFGSVIGIVGKSIAGAIIFFSFIPLLDRHLGTARFLLVDLLFDSIIVNAYIFVRFGRIIHYNLGDDLNWYLVKKLQRKKISLLKAPILDLCSFFKEDNYLIIGSTITWMANEKTVIWGAGVMDEDQPLKAKPKKVCAVRGPLSRKYLLEKGVNCPEVYGDPALLMKYFYKPNAKKRYKLGVIPHYIDFKSGKFDALKNNSDVLFIKMQDYKSVQDVIDQIASCEMILSSSLHGLILSETYDVPNIWMKVSDNIAGGAFKYLDYYESMGIHDAVPYLLNGNESEDDLVNLFSGYKKGFIDLKPLVKAAPFELNIMPEDIGK